MYKPNMEDKMAKVTIENKTTVNLHGLKPNGKMIVEASDTGVPKDRTWRRRIADGDVVIETKKVKKPKQEDKG